MKIFRKLWQLIRGFWTRPQQVFYDPLSVRVQHEYRYLVKDSFYRACDLLARAGYQSRAHRVRRVDIVEGVAKREKGWAVPCSASPTGWAGGFVSANKRGDAVLIVLVGNPPEIMMEVATHEWQEAILWESGIRDLEMRHRIIEQAGRSA